MLDFPSLLYKGLRILMFQLSGVYCKGSRCVERRKVTFAPTRAPGKTMNPKPLNPSTP